MITLPQNPQTHLEIFKTAYQISKISFLKTLPLFILAFAFSYAGHFISAWIDYSTKMNNFGQAIIGIILLLVSLFFCYAAFGGAIYRMHSLTTRQDPGFGDSFYYGNKKVFPLIAVGILYALATLVGLILLIVPGIMVMFYLAFSMYLLYMDFGIIDSIKESYRLIKNNWWRTLINILLVCLATILVIAIFIGIVTGFVVVVQTITGAGQQPMGLGFSALVILAAAILLLIIYNYSIAFMLTCIYDLKIRKAKENAALPQETSI